MIKDVDVPEFKALFCVCVCNFQITRLQKKLLENILKQMTYSLNKIFVDVWKLLYE
jgi:hypothetical protein